MTTPRPVRTSLAILLTLLVCAACVGGGGAPKQKKKEVILRTEAVDTKVGREASEQVAQAIGIVKDPALNAYVNQVGQRLARYAPSGRFKYSFQVVDQDAPNAFALPGGFIYVSRGLLAMANSEDELAGVLGHEIVHVARRHAAARQRIMRDLPPLAGFSARGQVAAYGRDQERESDRLGQGLAALAGYDPQGIADFLTQLEASERLRLGFSRIQGYLDSHPATRGRVAEAGARARSISWTRRPPIAANHADFLRRIDGIVVGIGAAEGVFQGSRFLHADMGFSMRFPEGWKVINSKQAVGAVSRDRRGMVSMEFQGPGNDAEVGANEYIEEYQPQGLRVERLQRVTIAGLPAVRAKGRAKTPGRSIALHLTWFSRDGAILRITGAAIGRGGLDGIFNNVARSFRPITPAELRSIRETRLRVVAAQPGEALGTFSRRTRNEWNIQETAVMNGIYANAQLEGGQLMKVAISQAYGRAR